ncbi:MAG TPA: PAS domain-containing protein [Caulobacteraceae bacterium]|nr:PAS domain-containing protein [Caulobacteraceae bacterium]
MRRHAPFAIDEALGPRLDALFTYWSGLKRGEASIPFADDIDMAMVEDLCGDVFVLGVFEKPERFRLDLARTPRAPEIQNTVLGRFIDEVDLPGPLQYLRAQADAAVEGAAPAYYRRDGEPAYARLLLPAWGEGQVRLLLGAIEWL